MTSDSDEACQSLLQLKLDLVVFHRHWVSFYSVKELLLAMNHDDVCSLAIEQLCHILLNLLDEFVGACSCHDGIDGLHSQILVDEILILCDVDLIVNDYVGKQFFEVRLETRRHMNIKVFV